MSKGFQATIMTLLALFMEVAVIGIVIGSVFYLIDLDTENEIGFTREWAFGSLVWIFFHGANLYVKDVYNGFYTQIDKEHDKRND